jgi:hypothetical protein
LLAFFLPLWVVGADLVSDAGGEEEGGSPPPPAARAGVSEGEAISAIRNIASVTNLIINLIMRVSCFPERFSHVGDHF